MQVSNLSKTDYYKSRNIPIPKPLHKLAPQPSVRCHLLQPMTTMAGEIKRFIQNRQMIQNRELEHISYQKTLHELQTKIFDLTKILNNKQDQIISQRAQKQKQQRRIVYLEKQVFDLQTQLQKNEYEYKSMIEYLKIENMNVKSQYQQKISISQKSQQSTKKYYQEQLRILKQSYQLKLQSLNGNRDTLKMVSQKIAQGYKKDINYYINQINRLKTQLIQSQKQSIQKLHSYEQQNYILKQRIQNKQLEYSLSLMKTNNQLQQKNYRIRQLTQRINQINNTFSKEKDKINNQKIYYERVKLEREEKFKTHIEELINQKNKKDEMIAKLQFQFTQSTQNNFSLQKKYHELSTRISFFQFQKEETQNRLKQTIQNLKSQHKASLQNQSLSLKKIYQQKISLLEKQLEDCRNQLYFVNQKCIKISSQMEQKNTLIKQNQQKYRQKQIELAENEENYQRIQKNNNKLKKEIQNLRIVHENQKNQLKNQLITFKEQQINSIVNEKSFRITQLQKEITNLIHHLEQQNTQFIQQRNSLHHTIQVSNQKNDQYLKQIQRLTSKYESLNSLYQKQQREYKNNTDNLKRIIEDESEALKKNIENFDQIKNSYDQIKYELQLKQSEIQFKQTEIQTFKKQLKQSKINQDEIKLNSIKKCAQLQQKMSQIITQYEKQKRSILENFKKAQNHILNLQIKAQQSQEIIKGFQEQRQIYLTENKKIKQIIQLKQQSTNNLLNQLNIQRKQAAQKLNQQYKEKINKIQIKNQTLLQEINQLKQNNLQTAQNSHKYQISIQQLQKKLSQKASQITNLNQKLTSSQIQIHKLQQTIFKLNTKIITLQTQKKKIQTVNEIITQKLNKFEQNIIEMKKSNVYDNDLMQDLKSRNNRLLCLNQQQRIQIQYQVAEKQKYKSFIKQLQRQLELVRNQLNQKNQINQQIRNRQDAEYLQAKVRQIKEEYEKKNRQLFEKIIFIEEKINLKDEQLAQAKKIIQQRDLMLTQWEQKQVDFKKITEDYANFKNRTTQLVSQFQRCTLLLKDRQQQVISLQKKLKQSQSKGSYNYKQLQMKCSQFQALVNILNQKYQLQIKRNNDLKIQYESQINKIFKYKQQNQILITQIQDLKNKLRINQNAKQQIKFDLKRQFEQIIAKFRLQRQQVITQMAEQHQKIVKQLKKQISEQNEQKIKIKNEFHAYKTKADESIKQYQSQILHLHQTINKLKRSNEFLYEYKKRWDKISGEVKQYDHLDNKDVKQVDLSFSQSMKSSIIIQKPFFPKFEIKQGFFVQRKNLLETPQTHHKQSIQMLSLKQARETTMSNKEKMQKIIKKSKYRYEDADNNYE